MSVQERFDAARLLLQEHNDAIGKDQISQIDIDQTLRNIKHAGGTTEERLKSFSYEDILACITCGAIHNANNWSVKPTVLAKDLAKIFRGKDEVAVESGNAGAGKVPISAKKIDKMSLKELITIYDPSDSDNAVGKRLKEQSKGEPFLVFLSGRTVDVETSLKLLLEVKQGYEGRAMVEVNGVDKPVYAVGEAPDNYADENPIYHGRPLRPDGTCDQTNRSWEGVPLEVRQLVYLAINEGELTTAQAHDIMDIAVSTVSEDAMKRLRQRCKHASLNFNELQANGNLPKLRIPLASRRLANRPFEKGKKVQVHLPGKNIAPGAISYERYLQIMRSPAPFAGPVWIVPQPGTNYYQTWRNNNE